MGMLCKNLILGGKKMEKAYFPMFVDISEMKIIVAGGGHIAERRIRTLLKFASDVTVIAPEVTESLKQLEMEGRIICLHREYQTGDIKDADLVLAATNDRSLNQKIAQECREAEQKSGRRILLSTASDRSLCDFYFPSVIMQDEIVIGINSGGKDPGKVKSVRERLERS